MAKTCERQALQNWSAGFALINKGFSCHLSFIVDTRFPCTYLLAESQREDNYTHV